MSATSHSWGFRGNPNQGSRREISLFQTPQCVGVKASLHGMAVIPLHLQGLDPTIVFVGSRNVLAPGPGAAAYSVAKAGLTQLARVAALELAPDGIRVNVVHPDCVFDTGIWTPEILEGRAQKYGLTIEEYKSRNLLKKPVTSAEVARMVAVMAGPVFSKTTGAQVPIDGGNDRVV